MINPQIPIYKDWKPNGESSGPYIKKRGNLMLNFQIPIGKNLKSMGKPSDSYIKRLETQW